MLRITTLIVLLWSIPLLASAETVYVSDNLRVGVRAEPDNSVAPHGVVITGMRLAVLDHANGFIKIRNESGVEGWIKDVYVTPDKPAKLELADLQAAQAKLQAQLAQQDKLLQDSKAKATAMTQELATLKTENNKLQTRLTAATTDKASNQTVGYILYVVWLVMLGVGGFVAGIVWHRKQAMKRLGGLRV
jgi:uncharacterized protein YgiM (DUF1202 family)